MHEVTIKDIGARGDGIADSDGVQIYVPYTAPGDVAQIELRGDRGRLKELISKSPHRVTPPCPHFGRCGGCALQHLSTQYYADWKHRLVVDALTRAGFEESIVAPLIACPPASRRRAVFSVINSRAGARLGFNAKRSDQIEPVETCSILHAGLSLRLSELKSFAAAVPARVFDLGVTLCDNGLDLNIVCDRLDFLDGGDIATLAEEMRAVSCMRLSLNGEPAIEHEKPVIKFGAVAVSPPPGGFLQASKEAEIALADLVIKNIGGVRRVADLFAGSGTFTFPLSTLAAVDSFDEDKAAIAALDAAARGASLAHPVKAVVQNLFDRPVMAAELKKYDAVIIDPPRAGARVQTAEIAASAVKTVVSVSCNPVSFARDAAILRDGGYILTLVTPVDQFVYSPHVELVGIFQKR